MPREAGMPMGVGTPRKPEESTHKIFSDGTYSNAPTAEVKSPKIWDVFKTKSGSFYQIIHMDFGGVYVTGHPFSKMPRVQDCDFWEMDKFFSERADG